MFHRWIYVSTIAAAHLPSTVEDILLRSVANNRRDGISGLLVCDGVHFAQALEGDEALVEACLERIVADERHRNLHVRTRETAPARLFPRWSMCALYLSPLDDDLLASTDLPIDLEALAPGALQQHLIELAERCSESLDAEHDRLVAALG